MVNILVKNGPDYGKILRGCFPSSLLPSQGKRAALCKVFGHRLDEIGSRHEDGEGADDGEQRERHQA